MSHTKPLCRDKLIQSVLDPGIAQQQILIHQNLHYFTLGVKQSRQNTPATHIGATSTAAI